MLSFGLTELSTWNRMSEELVDRRASPWDDSDRRPSHADRRNFLRHALLENKLQGWQEKLSKDKQSPVWQHRSYRTGLCERFLLTCASIILSSLSKLSFRQSCKMTLSADSVSDIFVENVFTHLNAIFVIRL